MNSLARIFLYTTIICIFVLEALVQITGSRANYNFRLAKDGANHLGHYERGKKKAKPIVEDN